MRRNGFTFLILLIVLGACDRAKISGRIVDPFGKGVPDATVSVVNTELQDKTDREGHYSLKYIPGSFKVKAEKPEHTSLTVEYSLMTETTVPAKEITLYPNPPEDGMYYIGAGNVTKIDKASIRATDVKVNEWFASRTVFSFTGQPTVVLPAGAALFIDKIPAKLSLARSDSAGKFFDSTFRMDSSLIHMHGLQKDEAIRVGDEKILIRKVELQNGNYGWAEFGRTLAGTPRPGEHYYGFRVGKP